MSTKRAFTHPTVFDFEFGVLKSHLELFRELAFDLLNGNAKKKMNE